MAVRHSASGSIAEDLFIQLFSEAFGAEKAGYLYSQYHFYDIYQNSRYADFALESNGRRVAIEIDDEASHHKGLVASGKFYDDLLKQNSMVYLGWDVYRWAVRQMQLQPELVKDELRVFLGNRPRLREIEDYLPPQRGRALDGGSLELKKHQREALEALRAMRERRETIALLCHATGTGKTVTAVLDAKRCGGRTLFLAHTQELVDQAAETFRALWPEAAAGRFMEGVKEPEAHVVCGSVQSVALHLEAFKDDAFDYLIIDEAHHAAADTYQKVLAFFRPRFTLGLTATPERSDGRSILEIFRNTAHKLDIQTAGGADAGAVHPHPDEHRLDQGAVQQRPLQHPGPGDKNLCARAQPPDRGHMAPVCPGTADCGVLRLCLAREGDCGPFSGGRSARCRGGGGYEAC